MRKLLASLVLCALCVIAVPVEAATALILTQAKGYQPPSAVAALDIVTVQRSGVSSMVAYTTIANTERLLACNDPNVAVGSKITGNCKTRAPGRTDNWYLKSDVIASETSVTPPPVVSKSVTFKWSPVTQYTNNTDIGVDLEGYTVTPRHQNCDAFGTVPCNPAANDPTLELGNVTEYTINDVVFEGCIFVQARVKGNIVGTYVSACGKPEAVVLIPKAVEGLQVVPPATVTPNHPTK